MGRPIGGRRGFTGLATAILQWGVFLAGGLLWLAVLWRLIRRQPLLSLAPRTTPSWGLLDFLGGLVLLQLLPAVAASAILGAYGRSLNGALTDLPPSALAATLFGGGIASLAAAAIAAVIVRWRKGGSWLGLGFNFRFLLTDFLVGGAAFLLLAPIVYGVLFVCVQFMGESRHPLIEALRESHSPAVLAAAGFAAVIAAPIAEEFVFRSLLQGWLEKVFQGRASPAVLIAGGDDSPAPLEATTGSSPTTAIVLSSLLFAMMHFSHGPDPIALFVLSLGLGYLYHRTHRLAPCIAVHFLNNAFSFAILVDSLG